MTVPTILFSQLPSGHVALVLADRTTNRDVAEVFLKLNAVPARGSSPAKPSRIYAQRIKAQAMGGLVEDEAVAKWGADYANGELMGHDPQAYALFPVDEDLAKFRVGSLRPALAVGRDFLDTIARGSAIPAIKEEAEQLAQSVHPLLYAAPLESVGVESDIIALLRSDSGGFGIRAKFRLKDAQPQTALPPGDSLDVIISARVYDALPQYGLPPVPFAQGPEVRRTARVGEWTVVDLELPPVPATPQGYFVVAKVYSHDLRYRSAFEPSECYVRQLAYGS